MSTAIENRENFTPMFKQYFDLKERCPGCLLLFRCGDFYELYGEDAVIGSKAMEIALTSREAGKGARIEMAGVPYHALDNYLRMLISKGLKVALCEQMEDPKKSKGLVKRDVVKIVTSGTILDQEILREDTNNFLVALYSMGKKTALAAADISTGEMRITSLEEKNIPRIEDEIFRIRPSEVVLHKEIWGQEKIIQFIKNLDIPYTIKNSHPEDLPDFEKEPFSSIEWENIPEGRKSALLLLNYIRETQKTEQHSLNKIEIYDIADYMVLDTATWRNLEISQTMTERQKKGSLLWAMDETNTSMGARLLRAWLERPLLNISKINARLEAVEEICNSYSLLSSTQENLKSIHDLERITSRIVFGTATPKDLLALGNSLRYIPALKEILSKADSSLLRILNHNIDTLEDIRTLIEKSIKEDASINLREGNIIRTGYNMDLDQLREIRSGAKQWIARLEETEKEKTGIKSLKVRFNNVFGYFIEVTKPNLPLIPKEYIRKQTIANGERFISPELKEYESKVLGAEEKIIQLEANLFINIRNRISSHANRIQQTSRVIANIDVLCSFASIASKNQYCRPEIFPEDILEIKGGRHPVVEKFLGKNFVPNDTALQQKKSRFHIITGPNMSGKSTYLRQIGLICIMAQMGSFVPADFAKIGIIDRIFTRVGASDDLHHGKSTFLVEMSETSNIINNATRRSMVLLDEIGRGTSTYDGLSIAWAVSEHIHNNIGARALFATHFHQLTELAQHLKGVENFRVDVKETNKEIIFLHRIVPGGTDKSYGIYVAKLAGLPNSILKRAGEILQHLETSHPEELKADKTQSPAYQLTFFDLMQSPLLNEIKKVNPDELSPREALDKIYEWKRNLD